MPEEVSVERGGTACLVAPQRFYPATLVHSTVVHAHNTKCMSAFNEWGEGQGISNREREKARMCFIPPPGILLNLGRIQEIS